MIIKSNPCQLRYRLQSIITQIVFIDWSSIFHMICSINWYQLVFNHIDCIDHIIEGILWEFATSEFTEIILIWVSKIFVFLMFQPRVLIVTLRRSPSSIKEVGSNVAVVWRPDSSVVAVSVSNYCNYNCFYCIDKSLLLLISTDIMSLFLMS